MKIAFFSTKSFDRIYFDKYNTTHELHYFEVSLKESTTNLTIGFECVCPFVNDNLSRKVIEKLVENGVRLIALRSAGFNNVDLEATKEYGMKVVRVPAYSPEAVAEHAVALILALNRKTHKAYNRIREGNFSLERLIGFDLYQKKVGVIGTGKIGRAFCKIMLGFGCQVFAHDLYPSDQLKQLGVQYLPLNELLPISDVVALHCPLTPETHHIINEQTLSKMKKGAMLINTSRGALVNSVDAIDALKTGQLGYMGIDVYEQEEQLFFKDLSDEIIQDDVIARLLSFPNVLVTSHQGFLTDEALSEIAEVTLKNISQFEQNLPLENEVRLAD